MPDQHNEWLDAMRSAIGAISGAEAVAGLAERWRRFAEHRLLTVTFYGPYDSGKSSLLKRLLAEDGTPVPSWLTISARHETFEVNEADSGGITYRDCPGISTGNERHETVADDALATTDALVLTLPPQLMTTGREHMLSVVGGEYYGLSRRSAFPAGALLLVVAQADTMGPDPVDDPDGYRKMCERKRGELGHLLRASLGKHSLPIHVVIADAYGMTAMKQQPRLEDYAAKTESDGITALRGAFHDLAGQRDTLRRSAEVRYWSLAARHVTEFADEDLERTTIAADEARRARAHLEALEEQLNELNEAAVTDLQLTIHNELRSIAESAPGADLTAVQAEAKERLGLTVEVWGRRWDVQLSQLARDSASTLTARARRPGAAALDNYLGSLLSDAARGRPGTGHATTRNIINYTGLWAPQIAREAFRLHTGMSPVQAQINLEDLRRSSTTDFAGYTFYTGSGQFTDVQRHLKEVRIAEVVPLLIQLGTLIWSLASERQLASQERQRREQLQASIQDAAKEMSNEILEDGWKAAIAGFREQLHKQMPPEELLASMQHHIERLTGAKKALEELARKA